MSNQNQPLTIDVAKVVFEAVEFSKELEADSTELYALLQSLPADAQLNVEASINEYVNRVREISFLAGWQLAKQ